MKLDVDDIIKHFTNQNKMAIRLGVTRQAIAGWRSQNAIPANRAIQIENITKGEFKAINMPIIDERD